jgi:predicted GIY-YIG superfamily endonuclease
MMNARLKDIYKAFGLRRDIREARKFLKEINPKKGYSKMKKEDINKELRQHYDYIGSLADEKPDYYLYVLSGITYEPYISRGQKKWTKPQPISMTFYSKHKYLFQTPKLIVKDSGVLLLPESEPNADPITEAWMSKGTGSDYHNVLEEVTVTEVSKKQARKLTDTLLFNASVVDVPQAAFNGFRDSGDMKCVPETILHHLKKNGKHKKLKLLEVVDVLNSYNNDDDDYVWKYDEDDVTGRPEKFEHDGAEQGYTANELIYCLEHFRCSGTLIDVQQQIFLKTDKENMQSMHGAEGADHSLTAFVGMVYGNHLYYCTDDAFVRSITNKKKLEKLNTGFSGEVYVKEDENKKKKPENTEVVECDDLWEIYETQFAEDNRVRHVGLQDGKIKRINYDNTVMYANQDKDIMLRILGNDFVNQNLTTFGNEEFNAFYPTHKTSAFNERVWAVLSKHGNIVRMLNYPKRKGRKLHSYDINKCRTDCWLNNKCGAYGVFGVHNDIEYFKGKYKDASLYYVCDLGRKAHDEFFMRGVGWYSGGFVKQALINNFKDKGQDFMVKYEINATTTLPANYFAPFVKHIVDTYPQKDAGGKPVYKYILNACIGWRGKTQKKVKRGYIERDYSLAVAAIFDNNDEKIGFISDEHINKSMWQKYKGRYVTITEKLIGEDKQWLVERIDFESLAENNDLPIYNKVLENEMLRVYELRKALGGRAIKIKTDAIVVEGKHNKIDTHPTKIGGIKYEELNNDVLFPEVKPLVCDKAIELDLGLKWHVIKETEEGVKLPPDSCLITGLAGFGKSHLMKQQPEYNLDTTLRLGFTNVSCENLENEEVAANTINSCFGVDYRTGKCSEKKLKALKDIKCIIITEIFMVPSKLMALLARIKREFNIKFLGEGDYHQNRPVQEESIDWMKTQLLHTLFDGNQVELTINKRNNETANYHRIMNGLPLPDFNYVDRPPRRINLVKTNKMRWTLNDALMDKHTGYFVKRSRANKYSQDVWLTRDTPIMCVRTDKKKGLKNGKTYALYCIANDIICIIVKDETLAFTDAQFAEHFVVCYAMTNHKVQGITIKEDYNIYEWDDMNNSREGREPYTAYSRCSDGKLVRICKYDLNQGLCDDLSAFFKSNYCIYIWRSTECNNIYIGHTSDFAARKKAHEKNAVEGGQKLHTYMQKYGGWKMEKLHDFYASSRVEAEKMEQHYMDQYNIVAGEEGALNMINAVTKKVVAVHDKKG